MPSASAISPDILDTQAGVRIALLGLGYNPGDSKRSLQAAVKQFQAHHGGLAIDGIAGPQTKAAMIRALTALNPIDLVFTVELNKAGSIDNKLDKVLKNQEKMMSDLDDMIAAQSALSADLSAFASDFTAAIAALQAAVNSGNSAQIKAEVQSLKDMDTQVQGLDAAAKAAVPPP